MLRALALTLLLAPTALAQDPDPRALLEAAAQAARELHSATYQGHSSVTSASGAAGHLAGEVRFRTTEGADPLGAQLYVRAQAPDATGVEVAFKLTCDGALVRGQIGAEQVIWFSALGDAGRELLEVGDPLLMEPLYAPEPFGEELASAELSLGAEIEVGGVACREVVAQFGEERRGDRITYALSLEDHLPRQRVGEVHRRGVFQTEILEISALRPNVGIHPSVFKLPTPTGYEARPFVSRRPQHELLAVGSEVPEIELPDAEGHAFRLSEHRGQVVVLAFWATWVPLCGQALPQLQTLHERFASDERVEVWGLATQERKDSDPAAALREAGCSFGTLLHGERAAAAFHVASMPTFYVIGTDGRVLHASVGFDGQLVSRLGDLIEGHLKAE